MPSARGMRSKDKRGTENPVNLSHDLLNWRYPAQSMTDMRDTVDQKFSRHFPGCKKNSYERCYRPWEPGGLAHSITGFSSNPRAIIREYSASKSAIWFCVRDRDWSDAPSTAVLISWRCSFI